MAAKVRVSEDTESSGLEDRPTARAWVRLKDGRTLTSSVGIVPGDRENPLPREAMLNKFRSLTTDTLEPQRQRRGYQSGWRPPAGPQGRQGTDRALGRRG